MRSFLLLLFQGPRRPWWLTPVLVVLYPVAVIWFLRDAKPAHVLIWFAGYPLLLWWQVVRFAEVAQFRALYKRRSDWRCPVCEYPLGTFTKTHDPQTSPCPECGNVPKQVIEDAKRKLDDASKWS